MSLCIKNIQPAEHQVALQLHMIGYLSFFTKKNHVPFQTTAFLLSLHSAAAALSKMQSTCYLYTQLHPDINPDTSSVCARSVDKACFSLVLFVKMLVYKCKHMHRTFLVQWTSRFIDSGSTSLFDTRMKDMKNLIKVWKRTDSGRTVIREVQQLWSDYFFLITSKGITIAKK